MTAARADGFDLDGREQALVCGIETSGAIVTSVETALFELLGVAGTDEFKQVQGLIK